MVSPPPTSDAVLERLKALHPRKIDLSLGRILRLLDALGNPERALPPVIHVAGTNGKGSTIAFMKAIAEAAGLKAHVYISPHLVRFAERIRPAGTEIPEDRLSRVLEECEAANGGHPITFFEITTAAALLAFSREAADLTLLETGLGGRLDATNVIEHPAVTVITPISLDHQHFLGNRLSNIAGEKAGILKRRVPAVIGPQHPIASRVITEAAGRLGAPLIRWNHEYRIRERKGGLMYLDGAAAIALPEPGLAGPHQRTNSATAIAALRALCDPRIDANAVRQGIAAAHWPARLQRLGVSTLTAPLIDKGFEVLLDGGHNPAAGRAIARSLQGGDGQPLYLIVGMIAAKDAAGFVKPLAATGPSGLWAVAIPGEHDFLPPERIAAIARRAGIAARDAGSLDNALAAIAALPPGRVLITGSLYLAGAVLERCR